MFLNSKQRKATALNARLNYLVDSGLGADEIKILMPNFNITVSFINNIILKRKYEYKQKNQMEV